MGNLYKTDRFLLCFFLAWPPVVSTTFAGKKSKNDLRIAVRCVSSARCLFAIIVATKLRIAVIVVIFDRCVKLGIKMTVVNAS